MITSSFAFLDGIGPKAEQKFHDFGIKHWDDFLSAKTVSGISAKRKAYYGRQLGQAKSALCSGDVSFFAERFSSAEMWRLYEHFKEECCFLDVEVDSKGNIIVLTLFDRFESRTFVKRVNLERELLETEIKKYKILVTYNGSAFDIPKIEKQFGLKINVPHIDLKGLCQRLGFHGGLKAIEQQLGISRPPHLRGSAVDLWKSFWASGDWEWLELLVAYNEADAVNLYQLIEKCVVLMKERIPIRIK